MDALVYILYYKNLDSYYIGHTTESIDERLRKHLTSHSGFTSKAKDWIVVYTENYADKSQAYRRELQKKNAVNKKKASEGGFVGVEGFEPPTLPPFGAGCSEPASY
jgi:putative endonuclease